MIGFIEQNRTVFGVEPICRVLPIAPSTYYAHNAVARNPDLACNRAKRDIVDCEKIKAVYDDSTGRHGARKVWRQLVREGHRIARCTVERLMKTMGLLKWTPKPRPRLKLCLIDLEEENNEQTPSTAQTGV